MSRLIGIFKKMRQVEPQPIGFMTNKIASEKPRLQLIISVSLSNLDNAAEAIKKADAAILEIAKSDEVSGIEKACQLKENILAGVWLKATSAGTLKKLLNSECDFAVFPSSVPLSVTQKEKLGKILELDASISEGLLRAAGDLPVDAVLVSGKEADIALTLNRVMLIQRIAYLVNKPILVSVPDDVTQNDLQTLWDMGISGVVIEAADEKSSDKLAEISKAISKLNPAVFRKKARMTALLPRMQPETPAPPQEDGGEEEDE
jgi:hypothetical protein